MPETLTLPPRDTALLDAMRASQGAGLLAPGYDFDSFSREPQDEESLAVQYALAVPRGIEGMLKGVYGFADFLAFDSLPDWKKRLLGQSTHWSASLIEGLATYALPGAVAFKAFGAAQKGIGMASRLARSAAAGAVVDAVVTDPEGGRLSDWARENGLDNAVTRFLSTDPEDSEAMSRFKNALEGLLPGAVLDGVAEVFHAVRIHRAGKAGAATTLKADDAKVRRALAEMWRDEFGFDHDQQAAVDAFIDAAGLDRSKIRSARELPAGATEGLAQDARAFTVFDEDGTAFIGALRNPDLTSGIHELAHVARRQLFSDVGVSTRIGLTADDVATAARWAGATEVEGGGFKWGAEAEEKFAAGLERYLRDGEAPSKGLRGFFEKVSAYFRRVYRQIQGTALDLEIAPEMRAVFDRVIRRGEAIAESSTSVRAVRRGDDGLAALAVQGDTPIGKVDLLLYSGDGNLREVLPDGAAPALTSKTPRDASPISARISKAQEGATYLYKAQLDATSVKALPDGAKPDLEELRAQGYRAWIEEGSGALHLLEPVPAQRVGQTVAGGREVLNLRAPGLRKALAKDADLLYQSGVKGDAPETGNARFDPSLPRKPLNLDRAASNTEAREVFQDWLKGEEVRVRETVSLEEQKALGIEAWQEIADSRGEALPFDLVKRVLVDSSASLQRDMNRVQAARKGLADLATSLHGKIKAATGDGLKQATDDELVELLRLRQQFVEVSDAVAEAQAVIARGLGANRIRFRGEQNAAWIPPRPEQAKAPTAPPLDATPGAAAPTPRPTAPEIPDPKTLPGASSKAILDAHGGRKKVEKTIRQLEIVLDANPGGLPPVNLKRGWFSMVPEYYINNILSGPITHAVNLTSGVINTVISPIERGLGAVLTGNPTMAARELAEMGSFVSESMEAVKIAGVALRKDASMLIPEGATVREGRNIKAISATGQGLDPDSIGGRALTGLGKVVNLPSRLLLTEDELLKQINYRARFRRRLTEIAIQRHAEPEARAEFIERTMKAAGEEGQFYSLEALRERGEQLAAKNSIPAEAKQEYVAAYIRTHWDEDAHRAAVDARQRAREATFTEDLSTPRGSMSGTKALLGVSAREALSKFSAGVASLAQQNAFLRLIVPFVRTPTNILQFFMDRSVGAVSDLAGTLFSAEVRKAITPEARAALVGRLSTGVALTTTAAYWASQRDERGLPLLTGAGPTDPNERKAWEATGWRPYSVRVGDRYVSYNRLDPSATFFGLVADLIQERAYSELLNRQPEYGKALIIAVANNIASKTYLLGAVNFAQALGDPQRYGPSLFNRFVGANAPFSSAVHQAVNPLRGDSVMHEIRSASEAFRSRWIGSDPTKLPTRRNVLGDAIERDGGIGGDPWSPLRYVQVEDDEIAEELVRTGAGFQPPRETSNGVDWTEYRSESGQTAYDRWQELHGTVKVGGRTLREALARTINSRSYQRLPVTGVDDLESPRVAALRRVMSRYREAARRQTFQEFPQLSNDARRILLAVQEMKRGEALTAGSVR